MICWLLFELIVPSEHKLTMPNVLKERWQYST